MAGGSSIVRQRSWYISSLRRFLTFGKASALLSKLFVAAIAYTDHTFQQSFEHVFVPKDTIEYPRPHSYMVSHVCSLLHVL